MDYSKLSHKEVKEVAKKVNVKIRQEHKAIVKTALDKIRLEKKEAISAERAKFREQLKKKLIPIAKQSKSKLVQHLSKHKDKVDIDDLPLPPFPKEKKLSKEEEEEAKKTFKEAQSTKPEEKKKYITKRIGGKIRRIPVTKLQEADKKKAEKKASIPKITVSEVVDKNEGGKAEVKSQLPPLKEKEVKIKLPKDDPPPAPKGPSELKKLKRELKSKGVPSMVLKFIKSVEQAKEKLEELEEEDDKSVKVDSIFLQNAFPKDRKQVERLVMMILPRKDYTLQDQRDYFDDLKDMAEQWKESAQPRLKYEKSSPGEKELFQILHPNLFVAQVKAEKEAKREEAAASRKAAKLAALAADNREKDESMADEFHSGGAAAPSKN